MSYHNVLWYRRSCIILYWNIIACSIYYTILFVVFYGIELNWIELCYIAICYNALGLQKSSTFVDLLNPRANVSGFGHVSLQKSSKKEQHWPQLAQSRFWLICYWILIGNGRKLASAGSEQILVDLLLNSNRKWKEIGLGWLRADFGWFAIEF